MKASDNNSIEIETSVKVPIAKAWEFWTNPFHIMHWNNATNDWQTTYAENDLKPGGKFLSRMEARDGSMGFDFSGVYDEIVKHAKIRYHLDDGRKVRVNFNENDSATHIVESFEAESTNPVEMQRDGWQAILNNFKKYAERDPGFETYHYESTINEKPEEVYRKMLDMETYRKWTKTFNPDSKYIGSWEKGDSIQFQGTDENGNVGGMNGRIKENISGKFISIEYINEFQEGHKKSEKSDNDKWTGALENYTFIDQDGKTLLKIDIDTVQEYSSYFEETWPKALDLLKSICESK